MSKKTRTSFAPFAVKMLAAGLPEIVIDKCTPTVRWTGKSWLASCEPVTAQSP